MTPLEGVDVSNHNGALNWKAPPLNVVFGYAKASESVSFTDPFFQSNWQGMKANGIIAGAYHFWRPDADPVAQIQHFASIYPKWMPGELPPALDVEMDPGQYPGYTATQLAQHVTQCLQEMERLCGKRPVLYTYPDFWRTRMGNTAVFTSYPLWLAAYPTLPSPLPGGWQSVAIHQYTGTGLDRDRWYGTLDELKAFCGVTPAPAGSRYFPQTGHYIGHGFRDKWEQYEKAGLALEAIGYPITEEQQATIKGWTGTVQYFERARFEYHAETSPPSILFGRLGAEALGQG